MHTPTHALEHLVVRPAHRTYAPPILLLHGAWHGAWCWERALADLAARGFEAHAISLRGHGGSPAPANHKRSTILDYAREARAVLAELGGRPLLVGHSFGGYITQLLITGAVGPVPPVAGAVLLCSSPINTSTYFIDRGLRGAPMVDIRALLRRDPATIRHAFFRPETPETDIELVRAHMVAEPPLVTLSSMLLRPRPAACRAHVLVIAAERDAVYDVEAQRATAEAYHAELVVVPGATHNLMLDPGWPIAAQAIERLVLKVG
jgi:pimeloyl-ACP methyl ester carboxylesterase